MAAKKKVAKKTATKAKKRTAAKRTTAKKATRKKATAKKATRKKATRKKAAKSLISIEQISASARKLMLANLGLYGKVIDELESQADKARDAIDRARREAPDVNADLIKRGETVVKDIKAILKKADMPTPPKLDKQIARLRTSIKKLRQRLS